MPGSACCDCCTAAAERGELDHALGAACPYPACDYCSAPVEQSRLFDALILAVCLSPLLLAVIL